LGITGSNKKDYPYKLKQRIWGLGRSWVKPVIDIHDEFGVAETVGLPVRPNLWCHRLSDQYVPVVDRSLQLPNSVNNEMDDASPKNMASFESTWGKLLTGNVQERDLMNV